MNYPVGCGGFSILTEVAQGRDGVSRPAGRLSSGHRQSQPGARAFARAVLSAATLAGIRSGRITPRRRALTRIVFAAAAESAVLACGVTAHADDGSAPLVVGQANTVPATPAAPAPAVAGPPAATLSAPAMAGPLALAPSPYSIDLGPAGKTYISGVVSGLGLLQSHPVPGNATGQLDLSNGQAIIQKIDGLVQYYVQVGAYSLPALGSAYTPASRATGNFYGPVPEAFFKLAPTDSFSIEAGKLPTLIGAENTFSFENMNIERGLLWNQEPAISRGVQLNYTTGPLAFAVSLNDGYYSDRFNWLSGSVTWTIDSADTLTFAAGGALGRTGYATFATPLPQNNGALYDLIYTRTSGPWTITPYLQVSDVPRDPAVGLARSATTYGGAVLAAYRFNAHYSLAGRVEYIDSTGSLANGTPDLLYGAGSKAFSVTLTPTYQYNRFFARTELSYVRAFDAVPGDTFGPTLSNAGQVRGLLETGILF